MANTYPGTKDVRVEVKEEPPPEGYLLANAYLGFEPPSVVQIEYLTWEPDGKRQVDLKSAADALLEAKTGENLIAYLKEFGALFPGKRIMLAEAMRLVWLFSHFAAVKKEGMPLPGPDVKTWTVWPLTVKNARGEGMAFSFIPVPAKSGWPLFRHRKDEWDEEVYIFGELRRNVLKRLKHVDVTWEKDRIVVKPSCLYDALLTLQCLARPRAVLGTKAKQDAIAFFRVYRKRGKISNEEFEIVKRAIKQAWEDGEGNLEQLRKIGWKTLRVLRDSLFTKNHPRP